ncbi:MAG: DinB family protein [Oligoflexus sp.]
MKQYIHLMTDYNQWMNEKLIIACDDIEPKELERDRQAFFHSILGTWNHILVADIIWLRRIAGQYPHTLKLSSLDSLPTPTSLDQILFQDWNTFKIKRRELDELIMNMSESLTEKDLTTEMKYQSMSGQSHQQDLWLVLSHFFNHQTHHRGQLTHLIHQLGINPGATDLIAMKREQDLALKIG